MKTPKLPVLKEIFAFCTVGLCNFLQGFTFTYNAFIKIGDDAVTTEQVSLSGSISFAMMCVGAILNIWVINKFGRKRAIQIVYVMYVLSGSLLLFHRDRMRNFFYLSRVLSGLANSSTGAVLLYLSEICYESRRRIFCSFLTVLNMIGLLISYIVQYFSSHIALAITVASVACIGFAGTWVIPESKYWYASKNRLKEAEESSLWFDKSQTKFEIEQEVRDIRDKTHSSESIFAYLGRWKNMKKLLTAQALIASRSLCGRSPIAIYPEYFLSEFQLKYDPRTLTIVGVLINFLFGLIIALIIEKFDRRSTLIYSCSAILIPSLCIIIVMNEFVQHMNVFCPWLEVLFIFIYSSLVTALIFPLVNVIVTETVSSSREKHGILFGFCNSIMSLYTAIDAFVFPLMMENFGMVVPLSYFLIGNLCLLITIKFFVPDTRNEASNEWGMNVNLMEI